MPAPAGAIGAIGPLAAKMQFGDGWWTSEPAVVIWMIGVSLLAVSTIPMRKVHTFSVSPNMVAPLLALLAVGSSPRRSCYGYVVILLIIVGYVILIPFTIRTPALGWRRTRRRGTTNRRQQRGARPSRAAPSRAPHRRSMARLGLRRPPGP